MNYSTNGVVSNSVNAQYNLLFNKGNTSNPIIELQFMPRVKTGNDQSEVTAGKYIAVYKKAIKTEHKPFLMNYSDTGEDLQSTTLNTSMNTKITVSFNNEKQPYLIKYNNTSNILEGNVCIS